MTSRLRRRAPSDSAWRLGPWMRARTAAKSGRPWAVKAHDLRIEQRVAPTESRNGLADELRERPAEVRLAPRAQACAATVVMCPAAPRGRSPATALDYRLLRAYVGTLDRDLLCGLRAAHRDPEQA